MAKKVLFLDDSVTRTRTFRSAFPFAYTFSNAAACLKALPSQDWDLISLDHDLGGETYVDPSRKDCGMEVVRFIQKKALLGDNILATKIVIHTCNELRADEMVIGLRKVGYDVSWLPFNIKNYNNMNLY